MSINPSTSTLSTYFNTPIHFRKLDNRVERVCLYGGKQTKDMKLSSVISNKRILKRMADIQKRRNEEEGVKKVRPKKQKTPKVADELMEATPKDIYGNLETTIDGQKVDDPEFLTSIQMRNTRKYLHA